MLASVDNVGVANVIIFLPDILISPVIVPPARDNNSKSAVSTYVLLVASVPAIGVPKNVILKDDIFKTPNIAPPLSDSLWFDKNIAYCWLHTCSSDVGLGQFIILATLFKSILPDIVPPDVFSFCATAVSIYVLLLISQIVLSKFLIFSGISEIFCILPPLNIILSFISFFKFFNFSFV